MSSAIIRFAKNGPNLYGSYSDIQQVVDSKKRKCEECACLLKVNVKFGLKT